MDRITDRLDMTSAVDRGRKTSTQTNITIFRRSTQYTNHVARTSAIGFLAQVRCYRLGKVQRLARGLTFWTLTLERINYLGSKKNDNEMSLRNNAADLCLTHIQKLGFYDLFHISHTVQSKDSKYRKQCVEIKTLVALRCKLTFAHYANKPIQYTAIFHGCKNDNFQMKNCVFFLIFAQNIDRGYSSTHDLCFRAKIRKNEYPCKPQFYYIKVGCKGVFITRTCYHDDKLIHWDSALLVLTSGL